ncbi:MAG TPA: LysR family transcriptional regulator [Steroidobacteraceae bacterium]
MALQAFARVVELGGFTKAGNSLQLSKRTVSGLVQSLEKHLGVRLRGTLILASNSSAKQNAPRQCAV